MQAVWVNVEVECGYLTQGVGVAYSFSKIGSVQLNAGSSSKAFIPVIPAGIPTGSLTTVHMYPLHVSRGTTPLG
jgi:hypothetical protein